MFCKAGPRALKTLGLPYVRAMIQSDKAETLNVLTVFITFLNALGHLHVVLDLMSTSTTGRLICHRRIPATGN